MFMSFWNFNVKIVTQVVFNSVEWSPVAVAVFLIDLMTLMSDARPAACGLSASKYQQKRWGRISSSHFVLELSTNIREVSLSPEKAPTGADGWFVLQRSLKLSVSYDLCGQASQFHNV